MKGAREEGKAGGIPASGWAWIAWSMALTLLLFAPAASGGAENCLGALHPSEAVLVTGMGGRKVLWAQNQEQGCVPASTLKVLTALTAVKDLGMDHRFTTEAYVDTGGNLKIKGYGDPLLTSEVLEQMAVLLTRACSTFNDLILDDSYFAEDILVPGRGFSTNPYDAPVGALCSNFNTLFFKQNGRGETVSAEPETPLIPFAREKIRALGLGEGRITFTHEHAEATFYAGHLLLHFLQQHGGRMQGGVRRGRVLPGDKLILHFESPFRLANVLQRMLEFSNNFVANQIFVSMGARRYGPPGTLAGGVRVVESFGRDALGLEGLQVVEGSGLSRENRVTPHQMIVILEAFKPYRDLLKQKEGLFFKTGTLSGVANLAGYMQGSGDELYDFAIYLGPSASRMDSIVQCIRRSLP